MSDLQERLQAALGAAYRVERELGGGGMSRVFVAMEAKLGRRVVIKVLPPELAAGVNMDRFRREIQLAASLQHPLIVPLLTAESSGDLLYYVMPLIADDSLRVRLVREGPLQISDAVRVLRDLADALAYAHRHGVVHRDIKPENVLLAEQHALVTDFGVAKALSQSTGAGTLTTVGVALGTPAYMAPEQAAADPDVDHRADIYAVGALGYEMLAGHPPFGGVSPQQVLAAQLTVLPDPVTRRRADVPAPLADIVMRCLEKEPGNRWQTAGELLARLEAMVTPSAGTTTAPDWAPRPVGSRLRRATLALLAAVVLAAGWLVWRQRFGVRPVVSPTRVAVLPFAVHGGEDIAHLGDGMVNLLGTSLDGAGELHSVAPGTLLGAVARETRGPLDLESGGAIAGRLGAGLFVLGDIVKAGDRLRIEASLYDRRQGPEAVAQGTVEGDASQLFGLVDALAAKLLANRSGGPGTRVTRIAAVTTSSLPALKAYLEGEQHFRTGRFGPAVESFKRAVATDTLFALAFYRLSIAAEWFILTDLARQAAEQAVRYTDRLSDHDRQLLEALLAARRGDAVEAERLYRAIVGTYPDDLDAWLQLGEVLFHYGPLLGRSIGGSREAFERVLSFDPESWTPVVHLARIAAAERKGAELDSLVSRMLRLNPGGDRALEMETLRAVTIGDSSEQERLLGRLRQETDPLVPQAVLSGVLYGPNRSNGERLIRVLIHPNRSTEARTLGHVWLGYFNLMRGQVRAARGELRSADSLDHAAALEHEALFSVLPFLPAPRAELEQLRSRLTSWNAGGVPPSSATTGYYAIHNGVHRHLRAYLLALVSARLGDASASLAFARDLERLPGSPQASVLARELAHSVRAQVAWRQGHTVEALAELGQVGMGAGYEAGIASPFYSEALERYLRGELLNATGRAEEALAAYASFEHINLYDLIYLAPSHLQRARIYEELERRDQAIAEYSSFIELWRDCDRELQPLVDEARSRVAALAGKRS